jgi:hypothetical protein
VVTLQFNLLNGRGRGFVAAMGKVPTLRTEIITYISNEPVTILMPLYSSSSSQSNMLKHFAEKVGHAQKNIKKQAGNVFNTTHVAVNLMLPVYYTANNSLSCEEFYALVDSWRLIQFQQYYVDDSSKVQFQHRFDDLFFERLFDVNPVRDY